MQRLPKSSTRCWRAARYALSHRPTQLSAAFCMRFQKAPACCRGARPLFAACLAFTPVHLQEDALLAYQICFDLLENEMQAFLLRVSSPILPL